MKIFDVEQQKDILARIKKATKKDLKEITKAKSFGFDWNEYKDEKYEVFKLFIEETNEILGLMCVRDMPDPGFRFVEVVALELRLDQVGKNKRYDRIAGCLLGFAARISNRNGYRGYLYLLAKTKTASIFEKKYGFHNLGSINSLTPKLASDEENSDMIISRYLES